MRFPLRLLAGVLPILAAGAGFAEESALERGLAIASGGMMRAGAQACFTCHGLDGTGDAAAGVPRLNGLGAYYLAKQMRDFAAGTRPHAVMSPIAKALAPQDILAVAAYYAALDTTTDGRAGAPPSVYSRGDPARGIEACRTCHGRGGFSTIPAIPTLAGQHAGYVAGQLMLWRRGARGNDPLDAMSRYAKALTPPEIAEVARWLASRGAGERS
ncbi:MAG: c-type cytochrome [Rhodospirillales bacterium]|nr:c-type cytochrome [Rhodospirillales bacterium]